MPISQATYERVALEDPEGQWELHCGQLRSKPGMTAEQNDLMFEIGHAIRAQISRERFRVRVNAGRARRSVSEVYIPDVMVIPTELEQQQRGRPGRLEVYRDPLPLMVEVWSRSTGTYDVMTKLPEYQRRGDAEIWLIHPYERWLRSWVHRPDGRYDETLYRGGIVRPVALPNVEINLDEPFAG